MGLNPTGDIYLFMFLLPSRYDQLSGANENEIKHDHSPVVIAVLTPYMINHTLSCLLKATV